MALRHFFRTIQKAWRFILIITLLAWSIALIISNSTTPLYRATATFVISPNADLTSNRDMFTSLDTLDKRTISSTYADILQSNRVYVETARNLNMDALAISRFVPKATVQPDSNILVLSVEGPDPQVAALLANNMGQNGLNYINGLYQVYTLSFLDQAQAPGKPFVPQPLREGGIAAAIGLGIGIVLAALGETMRAPLEALRERMNTDQQSGAFTQRHLKRLLEEELLRNPDAPVSLGLIEMEGLQDLLDALPAMVQADLMRQVAAMLRNQLRGNDMVARWGKFSFALLLPSTPQQPATQTIERIRKVLSEPLSIETAREPLRLAPGAGLSTHQSNETPSQLVEQAEQALRRSLEGDHATVCHERQSEGGAQ